MAVSKYKYGIELLIWTEFFRKENIDLIGKAKILGFDGIEIMLNDPDSVPVTETKNALKEYGMGVNFAAILWDENNSISPDKEVRAKALPQIKKCIDVSYGISGGGSGIGGIHYVGWGCFTGNQRTEQEWEWAVQYYKKAAQYASEKNITLFVEPLNRFETFFLNTAHDAVQFCKDVDEPNVKVHLDTYHMTNEEKDYYKAIVDTGEYLGYFHACENERGIPGTGLVQWDKVYRALRDINYKGWITIESFTPEIESVAGLTAIWRKHAPSSDDLAGMGLKNLKKIESKFM